MNILLDPQQKVNVHVPRRYMIVVYARSSHCLNHVKGALKEVFSKSDAEIQATCKHLTYEVKARVRCGLTAEQAETLQSRAQDYLEENQGNCVCVLMSGMPQFEMEPDE